MPSKKRSSTSQSAKPLKPRYFIDRHLGSVFLPEQLRQAGFEIVVHDDVYQQSERDPWIFYQCGKRNLIVVTSDSLFRKSFPHMAAIAFGKTTVITFSQNNHKSEVRGRAIIKARSAIEVAIRKHAGEYFIGVVGMNRSFRVCEESPLPTRKSCDQRDWDSYDQVCREAGVLALRLALGKPVSGM